MKKSNPPPTTPCHCGGGREDKSVRRYKNKSCYLFSPLLSINQLVVMVCMLVCLCLCLCVCVHMCVYYEADAIHYLFISPVCLAATLCISACLAIIMPHALFNTHMHTDSDADSYTSYLSLDMLTYRLVWLSHGLLQITAQALYHIDSQCLIFFSRFLSVILVVFR